MTPGSTPLDDFLTDAGSATDTAERLQRWGITLGIGGVTLAVGAILFLAVVAMDRRSDMRVVQLIVVAGGVLAAIGGTIELVGVASLLGIGWDGALTHELGNPAMMRLVGGAMIALGLVEAVRITAADDDAGDPVRAHRWIPDGSSLVTLIGASFASLSFGFDGHTATQGPRIVHAVANLVHVLAAGAWFGGLVALAVTSWRRRRHGFDPRVIHSFSTIATGALVAVSIAGAVLTLIVLDDLGDLTGTEWGRQLILKVVLVAVTAAFGSYNHFVTLPALDAAPHDQRIAQRARISVSVEVVVLVAVVIATGLLATASTN